MGAIKRYPGDPPAECDLCRCAITNCFVWGKPQGTSAWAFMCSTCHRNYGRGVGPLGKKYILSDGVWHKTPR